jgi:predicted CXXCH cytochrome family protein
MPAGERKTKVIGKRIDLSYHKQPSPMRSLRRLTVILCGLAAALWGGWALVAKNGERAYNPGPVAGVHAMIENNCASCHDGGNGATAAGSSSKFLKSVSDAACLKCHNASIHADKQISLASLTDGKPAMSSNCTTCHVEHKGHEALAGASDALCTRCHDNLTANVAGGKTDLQSSVKTFDSAPAHPAFGRVMRQGGTGAGGAMTDPTPLKFNHKKHLADINPTVGDCAACHHLSATGDHHIMQPVSFEANCKSCHPLTLAPGLPEVPHESMEIVRLFTSNAPALFSQRLAAMTPDEKKAALTTTTEKKVGLRTVKETKTITEAEWLEAQSKTLVDKVSSGAVANLPVYKAIESLDPPAKNAASLELYAAYGMGTSCSYCHTLAGDPPPVAKSTADLLHIMPTGYHPDRKAQPAAVATTAPSIANPQSAIGNSPRPTPEGRRWFTASIFDHESHRSANCTDCHGQARGSTLTSDVLLPDMQICATCHHNGGRDHMAASNNCVTCHIYHDRSKDTEPVMGRSIDLLLGTKTVAAK